jgi:SpoVK/Ycf46/Vps4 family AAA+-type ATPase
LYGPPGAGKTTFASSLASALGFRLITITVSDFLGAGGALVEARAKAIFQMLEAQSDSVILFDEIDAFLLDRDSDHYRNQDTLFQFLTPGMLTKINDLRKANRSIFIIATNYANRIDAAIKRPGRIDQKYMLLPPDLGKRKLIIEAALREYHLKASPTELRDMANASLYLGYTEIVAAFQRHPASVEQIINELRNTPSSTGHRAYFSRLTQETVFPDDELTAMLKLAAETGRTVELRKDIEALEPNARDALERIADKSLELSKELSRIK